MSSEDSLEGRTSEDVEDHPHPHHPPSTDEDEDREKISISKNPVKALFSGVSYLLSGLKEKFFPSTNEEIEPLDEEEVKLVSAVVGVDPSIKELDTIPTRTYVVRGTDTLPGVALRFNMTVAQLRRLNRGVSMLYNGMELRVFDRDREKRKTIERIHRQSRSGFFLEEGSEKELWQEGGHEIGAGITIDEEEVAAFRDPASKTKGSGTSAAGVSGQETKPTTDSSSEEVRRVTSPTRHRTGVGLPEFDLASFGIVLPSEQGGRPTSSELRVPKFLAIEDERSHILSKDQVKVLAWETPIRLRELDWILIYSTREHGMSFRTFYNRCKAMGPLLMVIQDLHGKVFGAFVPEHFEPHGYHYYGGGETFVFEITGAKGDVKKYSWTHDNQYFMLSTKESVCIGGGKNFAIALYEDFERGTTGECATFNSPPLTNTSFECVAVEVWGFYSAGNRRMREFLEEYKERSVQNAWKRGL